MRNWRDCGRRESLPVYDSARRQGYEIRSLQRNSMSNVFLTNYSKETFLDRIRQSLRRCNGFCFSVSFIKKAGLVLLLKDIEAALERGVLGRLIMITE